MSGSGRDHQGVIDPQRTQEYENRVIVERNGVCVSRTFKALARNVRKNHAIETAAVSHTEIDEGLLLTLREFHEYATAPVQEDAHGIRSLDEERRDLNHNPLHSGYRLLALEELDQVRDIDKH
jgi:hypothetical protein